MRDGHWARAELGPLLVSPARSSEDVNGPPPRATRIAGAWFGENAVDTVTHEMIHALGVRNEAKTECLAMQVSLVMALRLGVPLRYSQQLAHLNLANYFLHPPQYLDTIRCREGGAWDIAPNQPSPPWHDLGL
jgi:hypothetical protein